MDNPTKKSDVMYTDESEHEVNAACESLHQPTVGSKNSADKKNVSTLKSSKRHNVKRNNEIHDSSSSENSSSIDSSFLLDSYKVEQYLCKDRTMNDSVVYTRNHPVKSSTPRAVHLPESASMDTNENEAFKSSPHYSQHRKEPMGSENTSLPVTTSNKEKSKLPSQILSSTKQNMNTTQERIVHRKHQNSASDNSEFGRSITSIQYPSPGFGSVGQYARPPLIGQSSDLLLHSAIRQNTSESSESVTSNTSSESKDSLTYKVESLIGEKIPRIKIGHSNLLGLLTSATSPLQGKLLQKSVSSEIHPEVWGEHQKENILSQKHDFFSQEESHPKREFSDAVRPQIISSLVDSSDNCVKLHSQLSEQKQCSGESSRSSAEDFTEKKVSKQLLSESLHAIQCTKEGSRSSVNEPGVMMEHSISVLSDEADSKEGALSPEQFWSGKEDSSSHHKSDEYSSSDMEIRAKNTPPLLRDIHSVKLPVSSCSAYKPLNDHDFTPLTQDGKSSKGGYFSSSGTHSDEEISTELLSASSVATSTTRRTKQLANISMLSGTDAVSHGLLSESSSSLEMSSKPIVSLGILTSSPEVFPVIFTSSNDIVTSGTIAHSSGVSPVAISSCESLPVSSNPSNISNVHTSVLLPSNSTPSYQSVNNAFPPSSYVPVSNCIVNHLIQPSLNQTDMSDALFLTVSSDVNCVSSSSSGTASNIRSTVINTSSSDHTRKGNNSISASVATGTGRANDFSNELSTSTVPVTYNTSVSDKTALFTGSFSDSSVEPSVRASKYSPVHHIPDARSSASDSENVVRRSSCERHRHKNEPPRYPYDKNKFHAHSVRNFCGVTGSLECPLSPGKQNQITQKNSVSSSIGETSTIKNISPKCDSDLDQQKLHNLKRQVTGTSSSSSSSDSSCSCSQKSLSDQEAERSISEITVSAESIQTIISVPRKSSNADTEAEVSDESKNGCEHVYGEDARVDCVRDNENLPATVCSNTPGTNSQQHGSYVSPGFDPQHMNHSNKTRNHLPLRHVTSHRNEASVDESEKSEYQSDHRESPMSVSSLASSKRLEWDNGADIGYETAPGMLSNLERLKPSDFALLFRSDPEGGPLSNKKNTPSYQQTNIHNQLLTSDSAASVTPVEKTPSLSSSAAPSTSDERISSKRKNEQRLSGSASDDQSSSAKHYYQPHLMYVPKGFDFYDICVQTEPEYFTKEAGVQAKLSFRSEGSVSSSVGSTSSDHTVKVPAKNKRHRLRHTAALTSPGNGRTQVHMHAAGQPSHPCDSTHEGLREESSKASADSNHADCPLSDASFSMGSLLKGNATNQHFQHNVENSEKNSENSSEEEPELYSEHAKYFTDISNLQLQFPYPQQFLPSNISSVLVFDENSAYPEFLPDGADISELGDNVVFLRSSDHEQLLSDQTDGPHIRWYPVSGRSNSQEIRDAATQTAVSYIAEHDPEVYVDSQSEQSQINNSSNTISSAQVSESESLEYPSCNHSRVRKYSDSGKGNILSSEIQHSHYGVSESHAASCETRSDSTVPHLLESGESSRIFYHAPLISEETVPKSLTLPSSSSEQEKSSKNAYYFVSQNPKALPQSHDGLPRYEFQTLNYGDNLQSKSYDSGITGTGQASFHHSATGTRIMSGHRTNGNSASSWNNTQVPYEVTITGIIPPSESQQFHSERPSSVENVHYKFFKYSPKEMASSNNYGGTAASQNTPVCFNQIDNDQHSELESSSPGQTQMPTNLHSHHNNTKEREREKSKETLKSVSESTQKSKSSNRLISHSMDETLYRQHVSDGYTYHNKNHLVYLPDERKENHRSQANSKSEKLPHKRIGGVGGNIPLGDKSVAAAQFGTSANAATVAAYSDPASYVLFRHVPAEEVENGTDLESHMHSKEASELREGTLDLQTDGESMVLTSMSQSETVESIHTGSDDAVPPKFPPEVLGSRKESVVPSPGIYGSKKFTEKYGHQGLKKFPSDSNLYDSRHSNNMNSHVGRLFNVINYSSENSGPKKDSEETMHPSSDIKVGSDPKMAISCEPGEKQKVNMKNVDTEENKSLSQNSQATHHQANTARSENAHIQQDNVVDSPLSSKSESSDTATISISSEFHLSHEKNHEVEKNKASFSGSQTRDTEGSSRIASEPKSRVAQKAKLEISKLENLVSRQKKNYLRRLQLEIERLTRLESLVMQHTSKYKASSDSSLSSNGSADQTIPKYVSTGDADEVPQQLSRPQEPAVSYESETSGSSVVNVSRAKYSKLSSSVIPKHRNVKIQVSLGDVARNPFETTASSKSRTKTKLRNSYVQMKDFGQNCPTPVSSDYDFALTKSVGIQASDSFLDFENSTKSGEKVRLFISLEGAQRKEKSKKSGSSRSAGMPKVSKSNPRTNVEIPRSVAWSVSHQKSSDRRWKHVGMRSRDHSGLSLQDAFHRNCGHLIRRSQARLMRITKLAQLRSRLTAFALEKARFGQTSNYRIASLKNAMYPLRRHFTHKEIRLQTERVYKKLPEVVELKEKKKREEMYRTNRLMAEVYKKKLQEQVLKGKVSWTISQTCLTA